MINGVSAVRRVTEFDVSIFNTKIAAQVSDFDPVALGLSFEDAMRMDRYVQFACVAARMALEDSRLDLSKVDRRAYGGVFGQCYLRNKIHGRRICPGHRQREKTHQSADRPSGFV